MVHHVSERNPSATPTSVYRYYDQHDVLIYVGITSRGTARNIEHNKGKDWWPYVSRQDVEHFGSRAEAEVRERQVIKQYRPPFNRQHNPDSERLREAYQLLLASLNADPRTGWREKGEATVPLVLLERTKHTAILRTELAWSNVGTRIRWEDAVHERRPPVALPDGRCGRVAGVVRRGPLAIVRVVYRNGALAPVSGGSLSLKRMDGTNRKTYFVVKRAVLVGGPNAVPFTPETGGSNA